ncbi:hypothetical protein TrVE_jg327 [Triparma verrucosa]|uniref:SAC3/GANP/THP3 conserved domain-containing protein n=1 Tax=Triparma verrucosa TaxID=1606542 RepID=A0A9W7B786_9STRA|nr:hypothetical protein TrVE_jg327 [Triparma verrucosa]
MCSLAEASFRRSTLELSFYESTVETRSLNSRERMYDSNKCVKKYRRSAAGGVKRFDGDVRSYNDLMITLEYLCSLMVFESNCFYNVEEFVQDRIRGVNVELVQERIRGGEVLRKGYRMSVFSGYVLTGHKNYVQKFNEEQKGRCLNMLMDVDEGDEVMSFRGLTMLKEYVFTGKRGDVEGIVKGSFEGKGKVKFVIDLGEAWEEGNYRRFLKLITEADPSDPWTYLMRFIMLQCLGNVRMTILKCSNKAYGKGEKVLGEEMARLLFMKDGETAIKFAEEAGLSISEDRRHVVMKVQPVLEDKNLECRRDDDFVFGDLKDEILGGEDVDKVRLLKPEFVQWLLH